DRTIYVKGFVNADTDEYDQHLIAHEWMHYVFHEVIGRSDDPGGAHHPGDKIDPRLAFEEAFATVIGMKLLSQDDPHYVDTSGTNQAHSIFSQPLEEDRNDDGGFFSENSIEEILWDL